MLSFLRRYFQSLFFVPHNISEGDPAQVGLRFEKVRFNSAESRRLTGYFLHAKDRARGTIVHCHGNAGNITSHFYLVTFLVDAHYNVLVFDYGGYGASEGTPTPKDIIDDTKAALAYVRSRADVDKSRIILFGQSLGGAAAAGAMAQDSLVAGLILEGAFTTYRDMAFATRIGRLLFFLTPFVIPHVGPLLELPRIAPRPVLIIHGEDDDTIPVRFGERLYQAAGGIKSVAILKKFGHLDGIEGGGAYKEVILKFLERTLSFSSPS